MAPTAMDTFDSSADARFMIPRTCIAARHLVDIDQITLAELADINVNTLRNYESGISKPSHETWSKIKRALERAGVEFIPAENGPDGKGPGVRLKTNPGGPP